MTMLRSKARDSKRERETEMKMDFKKKISEGRFAGVATPVTPGKYIIVLDGNPSLSC